MRGKLLTLLRWIHRGEDILLASMLVSMIVLAAGQIILRNLIEWNFAWGDPVVRVLVLWVGMMGAMAASRRDDKGNDRHISIDVLSPLLAGRGLQAARILTSVFTGLVCGLLCWHCGRFVLDEMSFGSEGVGGIPIWVFQSVLPFAFGIMTLRYCIAAAVYGIAFLNPDAEQAG